MGAETSPEAASSVQETDAVFSTCLDQPPVVPAMTEDVGENGVMLEEQDHGAA